MRLAAAIALTISATTAQGAELLQRADAIPGRYIVVLQDDGKERSVDDDHDARLRQRVATAASITAKHGGRTHFVYAAALHGYVATMTAAQVRSALRDPRIAYIEQDGMLRLPKPSTAARTAGARTLQGVQPRAPWGLDRIDQRALPLDNSFGYARTGKGVHVYVIDSGLLGSHAEFAGRVGEGWSAVNDGRGTTDCHGHGTHVAGIVGGKTWGVAKDVVLHPVRVAGCSESVSRAAAIAGLDWVRMKHRKPAVATYAISGSAGTALDQAARNLVAAGVTLVVAAGNEDTDACTRSPARVAEAITVAASDAFDYRVDGSNYGRCVDLFAPGSGITSAWIGGNNATEEDSGTSMAAPHVAGAAALILEATPKATPATVQSTLLKAATTGKIQLAGGGTPNRLLFTGAGFTARSTGIAEAAQDAGNVGAVASPAFSTTCAGRTCTFDAGASAEGPEGSAHEWTFDDGTSARGPVVTRSFASPGTFNVTLARGGEPGEARLASATFSVAGHETHGAQCTDCDVHTGETGPGASGVVIGSRNEGVRPAGVHRGWLQGPDGADLDLHLERLEGERWVRVASSRSPTSTERIAFTGDAGTYRWRVDARRGAGQFTLRTQTP